MIVLKLNGCSSDIVKPLVGVHQANTETTPLPAAQPSLAIVEVSENMRAKLYALFCKIGFIELPGLTTEDHVTLTIVEHYLEFKVIFNLTNSPFLCGFILITKRVVCVYCRWERFGRK